MTESFLNYREAKLSKLKNICIYWSYVDTSGSAYDLNKLPDNIEPEVAISYFKEGSIAFFENEIPELMKNFSEMQDWQYNKVNDILDSLAFIDEEIEDIFIERKNISNKFISSI